MTDSIFFRLLTFEPDHKGSHLLHLVQGVNSRDKSDEIFSLDAEKFRLTSQSPFSYWLSPEILQKLHSFERFEPAAGTVRQGLSTSDDPQYVRSIWEIDPADLYFCIYPTDGSLFVSYSDPILRAFFARRDKGTMKWAYHIKAGASQPWYSPVTVVVDWEDDGRPLREFKRAVLRNEVYYFRPGFSWTRRAVRLIPYIVPTGCIHSASRYMAFPENSLELSAVAYCASNLATAFARIYGEKFEWPNFLVETIKSLPWTSDLTETMKSFDKLVRREMQQRRKIYSYFEPFQEFSYPALINGVSPNPDAIRYNPMSLIGRELEKEVAEAFGFNESQLSDLERDMVEAIRFQAGGENALDDPEDYLDDKDLVLDFSPRYHYQALLQYAAGCIFGRWDLRIALDPSLDPKPAPPFDPLPVCPPGTLVGPDGLPAKSGGIVSEEWLRARPNAITLPEKFEGLETIPDSEYPLPIAWDGVLVDDPKHPRDILARVRQVLRLLWGERADKIESEACEILGLDDLRDYFRYPNKGFFDFHIKRYSKSRRKAPLYWLLQSEKRNYGLWLYYHRLTPDSLFHAAREYVDPKLSLENSRLEELQTGLEALSGSQRARRERQITEQASLVDEIKAFQKELDRVALLELKPDLNDGVVLNIAPLHNLVPWKEAEKYWRRLVKGDYDWSSIAQQTRHKGLVKGQS